MTRTSAAARSIVAEIGSGVLNVGMVISPDGVVRCWWDTKCWYWGRLAHPAGEAVVAARASRAALLRPAGRVIGLECGRGRAGEPAVDRQPGPVGGLLDPALEALAEPEVDAGGRALVGVGGYWRQGACRWSGWLGEGIRQCGRHDEARIAPAQADVDRAGREVARDLVGRCGQRLEQREPGRRLQRRGQPLGELASLVTGHLGGRGQLLAERCDIRFKFHDASMAPSWRHCKSAWHHNDV